MTRKPVSLSPDRLDKAIGFGALILLITTLVALVNGRNTWSQIPLIVWAHLLPATMAMALTPLMLWRKRGDKLHRRLGYLWVTAMTATAGFSLLVKVINPGHFSGIHILSIFTLLNLPLVIYSARKHDILSHRRSIRAMTIGALLIAGSLTFTPGRVLANWLFGG